MSTLGYLKTNKIARYLNPIVRLGIRKYSTIFPTISILILIGVCEFVSYFVLPNPESNGLIAIFAFVAVIIYFAFRDGIKGGLIAVAGTLTYYVYIIFSRHYQAEALITGIQTVIVLGILYLVLALIIGWLKQTLDRFIEQETKARLDAEEGQMRTQTILQQLPVGILSLNAADFMIETNHQAEEILGIKDRTQLFTDETQRQSEVYKNHKKIGFEQWPIIRAVNKGEVVFGEEMEYQRRDGKMIDIRVNAAPILNKKRQIIGAVSSVMDITQEKSLEKRKNDFVNMTSHELKTPITSMKLYVDSLYKRIQQSRDERGLKMITGIKNQTERLQELVNDLLDVTRIQTGKLHFNREEFKLEELLSETVEMLQDTTQKHQILIKGKSNYKVYGDRFRIYQVITNLITNAIKYSPEGKEIIVRVKKEAQKVVISVQDFGIGISKSQQKKVFERLYQVNDSTEKTYPGLGMGLFISKEIVKRHKGSIWVEGEEGKGSTFYFTLPLKKN